MQVSQAVEAAVDQPKKERFCSTPEPPHGAHRPAMTSEPTPAQSTQASTTLPRSTLMQPAAASSSVSLILRRSSRRDAPVPVAGSASGEASPPEAAAASLAGASSVAFAAWGGDEPDIGSSGGVGRAQP